MNGLLILGFVCVIALFGAAGTQFIAAHLSAQAHQRRLGADQTPAQHWRKYRFPHARARAEPPVPGFGQRIFWGFAFLAMALALLFLLLWSAA